MDTKKIEVMVISPLPPVMLDELAETFTIHNYWLTEDKEELLSQTATRIRGVVTRSHLGINRRIINALPQLEMVSIFGVGLDAVDLDAARARNLVVTNTPKVLSECVADTGLALMLSVSRRICEADRFSRSKSWLNGQFPSASRMHGKICGIAGLGNVGQAVATRAQGFGMPIHFYDPYSKEQNFKRFDTLVALAESCDFLVLTLPGGAETFHAINKEVLQALGKSGILVNIARGTVVDTAALIEALNNKDILGAGLDVFEDEPVIPRELFQFDNVVLTPHLASNTVETRTDMANLAVRNIRSYFEEGQAITPVK
ncbi:2-hydroxyacid dehydrogenase [Sodalis sp. RH24]|uniref:2-hydroxyacid dehydrogenase n=1 Tax=unclassified Sodalis (in: enterobacteria) TaxID=2636512 RepID=UPI0039B4135C